MVIKGVIFDLGGTLGGALPQHYADQSMLSLRSWMDSRPEFSVTTVNLVMEQWKQRLEEIDTLKNSSASCCQEMIYADEFAVILQRNGVEDHLSTAKYAMEHFFALEVQSWKIYDGAQQVLAELKNDGFRLALCSNTPDTPKQLAALQAIGLHDSFEVVVLSSTFYFRKPDSRLFAQVLRQMELTCDEVVMVGDMLNRDICGANRCGIASLWIQKYSQNPECNRRFESTIQPSESVWDLDEVLSAVRRISCKNRPPFRPLQVAAILEPKKAESLAERGLFDLRHRADVRFHLVPIRKAVENWGKGNADGKFDVALLQVNHLLARAHSLEADHSHLQKLKSSVAGLTQISSFESIQQVIRRDLLHKALEGALSSCTTSSQRRVRTPWTASLSDNHNFSELEQKLPLLVKPALACGATSAHHLYLLSKPESLRFWLQHDEMQQMILHDNIHSGVIVQHLVDHGATLFKCYAIDGVLCCMERKPSLPDDVYGRANADIPIRFASKGSGLITGGVKMNPNCTISEEEANEISFHLCSKLQLSVIGFDLMVDINNYDIFVIDVIYFPGFRLVPDLCDRLADLAVSTVVSP